MNKNPLTPDIYYKRTRPQTPDVRGEYFRDQTKIIHSLPFRRLKHKTQVFFAPDNDHICTRIEHVLHVATIAAAICRGLNQSGNWSLDQDLAYAIGLGHDIGHAPFGHEGEKALAACIAPTPFLHEVNSFRVVELLANYGEGLNLTYAVKDGILCHCGEDFATNQLRPSSTPNELEKINHRRCFPTTYEGCIVRVADKIAYLGRDIEDAVKAALITREDIPQIVQDEIGTSNGEIINTLTLDLIEHSKDKDYIGFSPEKTDIISELKKFNYERIYHNAQMRQRKATIDKCIENLFDYFRTIFEKYGFDYGAYEQEGKQTATSFANYMVSMEKVYHQDPAQRDSIITDYIAGMTDSYALSVMEDVILPNSIKFFS
ncbi:MAG: HD domain-containing protein [Elusimicrobiaceae bacterium]|nr:HD domain-containing protein [Elusimicrobiaceae bacterium]